MSYTGGYAKEPRLLRPSDLAGASASLERLDAAGLSVVEGVRQSDLAGIQAIASEPAVTEFCPGDILRRFADDAVLATWLNVPGGRAVLLLRSQIDEKIVGYGWVRPESTADLPDCDATLAIRLSAAVTGLGLARPYLDVLLCYASARGSRSVGLELWASNTPAVRAYLRAGARLVGARDDTRPTSRSDGIVIDGHRSDTRLYMTF